MASEHTLTSDTTIINSDAYITKTDVYIRLYLLRLCGEEFVMRPADFEFPRQKVLRLAEQ